MCCLSLMNIILCVIFGADILIYSNVLVILFSIYIVYYGNCSFCIIYLSFFVFNCVKPRRSKSPDNLQHTGKSICVTNQRDSQTFSDKFDYHFNNG